MTEFSRPLPLDRIGAAGVEQSVDATASECAALAARMGIPAVHRLHCRFLVRRVGGAGGGSVFEAEGVLDAHVEQVCVVSLEPFAQPVAEAFSVQFVPSGTEAPDDDLDAPDQIAFTGHAIDLGEAAAQQLALALDPYPRQPGLAAPEEDAPDAASPFAGLAALRRTQ